MSKFDAQFAGRLDGQTVLVTGTTKGGIGHETAQGAGNSGATVLVHARRADQARQAVDLLVGNGNGKGQYVAVAGDLGVRLHHGWQEDDRMARRMNKRDHWNEPDGQRRAL